MKFVEAVVQFSSASDPCDRPPAFSWPGAVTERRHPGILRWRAKRSGIPSGGKVTLLGWYAIVLSAAKVFQCGI